MFGFRRWRKPQPPSSPWSRTWPPPYPQPATFPESAPAGEVAVADLFWRLTMPPGPMSGSNSEEKLLSAILEHEAEAVVEGVLAVVRENHLHPGVDLQGVEIDASSVLSDLKHSEAAFARLVSALEDERERGCVLGAFALGMPFPRGEDVLAQAIETGRFSEWSDDHLMSLLDALRMDPSTRRQQALATMQASSRWTPALSEELARLTSPPEEQP